MVSFTKRQRIFIWVFGGMIGTVILVIPLITYGFAANSSNFDYPKTICNYTGYYAEYNMCGGISKPFGGSVEFIYKIYNSSYVSRYTEIICMQSRVEIDEYFNIHYNNHTSWDCWYQRSDPTIGWIGFNQPYNKNGTAMVAVGFVIFSVFIFSVGLYLILMRRRQSKYYVVDDMDL